jgi:phospholipid/cholesterol/gamma-HCH transport system substrate-binding protein
MSRRASPKLIGGFVVGAIALMVTAALVFGTFTFFQNTRRFVVFFNGSVEGLTVGSPVLFRGVPIGQVTQVTIRYDRETNDLSIPVIVEINPGVVEGWDPDESGPFNTTRYRKLLDKGLRARLESTSLVTGQKAVQLEFFPGTPIVMHDSDIKLRQIPTVPSAVSELMSSAEAAAKDLPSLVKAASVTLDRAQALLSDSNQKAIAQILDNTNTLMTTLHQDAEKLSVTIEKADRLMGGFTDVATNVNGVVVDNRAALSELVRGLRGDVATASRLLDQANRLVGDARQPVDRFAQTSLPDLAALILEARNSFNKVSQILTQFDRNPSGFLLGDKAGHGVPLK